MAAVAAEVVLEEAEAAASAVVAAVAAAPEAAVFREVLPRARTRAPLWAGDADITAEAAVWAASWV